MCQNKDCNPIKHFFGLCKHRSEIDRLQKEVMESKKLTNRELEEFNNRLNLIIKDDNIKVTLSNIKRSTTK